MKKVLLSLVACAAIVSAKDTPQERIQEAAKTFDQIMAAPDKGIPQDLLDRAKCLVIVPGLKKAGFIVGGQYGRGYMTCRTNTARGFTGISAIKMEGGSIGAQIGAGETDVVLVVMNEEGAQKLMQSEFTIGGEADAMAGPVGRSSSAQTDALMHAKILSYSRSRGLFAGIALKGTTLRTDGDENDKIYGKHVPHEDILTGKVPPPAMANVLYKSLNRYFHNMPAKTEPASKRPSE